MTNAARKLPPLSGPFAASPSPEGPRPSRAISDFVHAQVGALLASSPAYYELPEDKQSRMRNDLEKIAAYTAALVQDEWASSKKLDQTPMLRTASALAQTKQPAADEFSPRAAGQVAVS